MSDAIRDESMEKGRPGPGTATTHELVQVLVQRAQMGDPTAAPRLRELFDRDPDRLMELAGPDAAASIKDRLAARVAGGRDILATEAALRRVDQLRDELAGPAPTPIERLLAERAALCWLELHLADARVLGDWGELDRPRAARLDAHRDRAQRRYLAALKSLATVRRLAVPALQINLAARQVNQLGPIGVGCEPSRIEDARS